MLLVIGMLRPDAEMTITGSFVLNSLFFIEKRFQYLCCREICL